MNTITNDKDELIGYYSDLVKEIKDNAREALTANEYEQVEDMLEVLRLLDRYTDEDGLLVISENNGMGYTVDIYKNERS